MVVGQPSHSSSGRLSAGPGPWPHPVTGTGTRTDERNQQYTVASVATPQISSSPALIERLSEGPALGPTPCVPDARTAARAGNNRTCVERVHVVAGG